jgi:TRAP-type mannitol/chloroaromatic compound transport system permease small subunit
VSSVTTVQPLTPFHVFGKLTKYSDNVTIAMMKVFRWLAPIIMFLIVGEVVMRYVFREPTIWNNDLQLYLSAGQRIIGIGYGSMVHMQIVMDIFTAKLSFKQFKALEIGHYIVFHLPLMFALIWVTGARSLQTFVQNEKYYSVWRPVLWPVLAFITFAYVLFVMQLFAEIIKDFISMQRGDDKWLKER